MVPISPGVGEVSSGSSRGWVVEASWAFGSPPGPSSRRSTFVFIVAEPVEAPSQVPCDNGGRTT
jgi:hypothetical protein